MKKCLQLSGAMLSALLLTSVSNAYAMPVSNGASPSEVVQSHHSKVCQGVVVDAKGQPIIGASVIVKGTSNGAMTNFDGKFVINNVKVGSTVLIKFIGYKDKSVVWDGSPIKVTLVEDNKVLNEVVVVGYGTQKKVNVTGSVSTVDSKQLASRPVQNVVQALQGTVPGLNMSYDKGGGSLGSSASFSIRGGGTIGTGSTGSPLVLIDGVEGDMNSLNPNDIASISVLKDAASSSIYGARGAFGVILITTKSGKKGQTHISYVGDVRFNTAIQVPDPANSLDFANYWNAAQSNQNGNVVFHDDMMEKIKNYLAGKYTDPKTPEHYGTTANPNNGFWYAYQGAFGNTNWFNEFYNKNVPSYEQSVSVSGGNDKITYLVSGGMLDQRGLLRHGKDTYRRFTLNSKISAKMYKWLTVNYFTKWTNEDYSRPQYLDYQNGLFFHQIARKWVVNPNYVLGHPMPWMEINEMEHGGIANSNTNIFTNQLQLIIEPIKDWHINIDGSFKKNYWKKHSEVLRFYEYNVKGEPVLGKFNGQSPGYTYVGQDRSYNDYYMLNVISDYSKQLGKHYFKIMGGFNGELYHNDWDHAEGTDLISDKVPYLSAAQNNFKANDNITELAIAGFFGRFNYNYDERYLFEANLRYDGSSRFVGNKRWGLFPSFSAGWNIANEAFFAPLQDKISTLKLRGSWGQLGNNQVYQYYPFFQTMPTKTANSGWIINGKQLNTAGMPGIISSLLTWEKVESWDLGFDFAALNNRLTGTFDTYRRYTYNMVGPAPTLPSILGTTPPRINNADMVSYGWEFQVNWKDQIGDFRYGVGLNLSDGMREILRYPNETGTLKSYYAGMKLGEIWGYTTVGIAQSQKQMDAHLAKNLPNWGSKWSAGDIMYKDLNGDGKVNSGSYTLKDHGDLRIIGNSTPRYNFGINLFASYKGLDFTLFLQGVGKRDYWATGNYFWGISGGMWQASAFKEHMDYWRPDNKNAYYPRPIFEDPKELKNQQVQTRYLQNAAYLRVKNIQLGYTLPQIYTKKAMLSKVRFYLSVDNLATLTKMSKAFDPETLGGGWGPGKLYPLQRSISIGLNLNL